MYKDIIRTVFIIAALNLVYYLGIKTGQSYGISQGLSTANNKCSERINNITIHFLGRFQND